MLFLPAVSSGTPTPDTIHNCDALTLLKALPDKCINCLVTSPPYFRLRSYIADGDPNKALEIGLEDTPQAFVARLRDLFREVRRVLRDDGTCWVNLGDSYATNVHTGEWGLSATHKEKRAEPYSRIFEGLPSKSLLGIPWRVAFALQDDGWILRSDIIWAKPNPMPESVTDRPTKAHEYVFLLTKSPRYWYDADAIREPSLDAGKVVTLGEKSLSKGQAKGANVKPTGNATADYVIVADHRNKRSVWTIPTEPNSFAHFATFPQKLIEPMILAGCPDKVCVKCGAAWVRDVEREALEYNAKEGVSQSLRNAGAATGGTEKVTLGMTDKVIRTDLGFKPTCSCENADTRPGIVLDPFMGVGTTALTARKLGRRFIGSELSTVYWAIAHDRLRPPLAPRKYVKPDKPLKKPKPATIGDITLQQAALIE